MQSFFLCVSIGTALLITTSRNRAGSEDRFIIDLLVSIGLSAAALWLLRYRFPTASVKTDQQSRDDEIPLHEYPDEAAIQSKEEAAANTRSPSPQHWTRLIGFASIALATRIEIFRRISDVAQCASRSWAVSLPLLLAINDYRYQRRSVVTRNDNSTVSTYGRCKQRIRLLLVRPRWRYIPPAVVLSYGCYALTAPWLAQSSSYICPITSGHTFWIPSMQILAVVLDCLLAIIAQDLAKSNISSRRRLHSVPLSYATILFGAVLCWACYALVLYFIAPEKMEWLLIYDAPSSYTPPFPSFGKVLSIVTFILSTTYCISAFGVYQLSMVLAASITLFTNAGNLWPKAHHLVQGPSNLPMSPFILICMGLWSSFRIAQTIDQSHRPRTLVSQVLSLVLIVFLLLHGAGSPNLVMYHPIDLLIADAKPQHGKYIAYASRSTDLRSAVAIYQERYQTNPPPGFDKWYEYARNRSVLIIDDYDQIYRDTLPFRAISPADLRKQTWDIISNPWNEISGISIRNGKAEVQENVLPTHRWMLEGVSFLINSFAQHLPDMDLAFNLNDESRIAVPYSTITTYRNQAVRTKMGDDSNWSSDRASSWTPVAKEALSTTEFENFSFRKNFRRFGTIGCAPNTLSVVQPYLSSQSYTCQQCLEPHSLGQFVSNWTLAADMCHQPDMSHLHGFYLSPAAFKTSHRLMPVFSQSKASGYNDILYPSSWNYMDKVKYQPTNATETTGAEGFSPGYPDPAFREKDTILYWRGATSEGVSAGVHTWRGMTRQRLVHLANNATSDRDHDWINILLPDMNRPNEYKYYSLPGSALKSLGLQQNTDIRITDHIARCGGKDCTDQEQEFGLVTPIDFQAHWKYKYLFDMDGAGFSGRFLPFLQSRSLPFKTALFREWYDSRLTAWRHFVPIDLRLHGVWSTLAYFSGIDGVWPSTGKPYKWEAHTVEAEAIAEEGRRWAGKVLRKEDMEVYFYRLLLEWGRLTDDRRDELGFVMK